LAFSRSDSHFYRFSGLAVTPGSRLRSSLLCDRCVDSDGSPAERRNWHIDASSKWVIVAGPPQKIRARKQQDLRTYERVSNDCGWDHLRQRKPNHWVKLATGSRLVRQIFSGASGSR
jgi:hypothetical protein